ncbi:MAG: MMPL family transporter [Rhodocyclaceae bacterium]
MSTLRQRAPLLVWLAVLIGSLIVIARTSFVADMSAFLPASPDAGQRMLIEQLRDGTLARLMIVGIEGGTPEARHTASKKLAAALRKEDEFVTVQNGEAETLRRDQEFWFNNRYLLSATVSAERFSSTGLRAAIDETLLNLSGSAGLMLKSLLTRDPTGEALTLVNDLQQQGGPRQSGGVWVSRDDQRALLLLQTRAAGSDTDALAHAIATIEQHFASVKQADQRVVMSGAGVFSVQSRDRIKQETSQLASLSTLFIIVLLLSIYRSPRLLALGMLPVVTGALIGVAAVSLGFGHVHGLTLGFGTTLIGEAVDYGIYFFVQTGSNDARSAWQQRFWRTVALGVLTSICGFGALLVSGFPGLAQLGLYSIAGLIAAALTARFVMPQLMPARLHMRKVEPLGARLQCFVAWLVRMRPVLLVLIAACAVLLVVRHDRIWNHSISALNPVPEEAQQLDGELRRELGAPDTRYLLVRNVPDAQTALQAAEAITPALQALTDKKALGGFDSPARLLPSDATQRQRQAALPAPEVLKQRLATALKGAPLNADKLQAFIDDVAAARTRPLLTRADLDGTASALALDAMLVRRSEGYSLLIPLRASVGHDIDADAVRAALDKAGQPELLLVDLRGQAESLYGTYLNEAIKLSVWGFAGILLLFVISLRSFKRVLQLMLPLAGTVVLVMAGMMLLGQALSILHLIGLLLSVAIGSNYALFFHQGNEAGQDTEAERQRTLVSLAMANIATVVGFGLLATSTVSVLQALGGTVGPGALLSLLLAAAFTTQPAGKPGAA